MLMLRALMKGTTGPQCWFCGKVAVAHRMDCCVGCGRKHRDKAVR